MNPHTLKPDFQISFLTNPIKISIGIIFFFLITAESSLDSYAQALETNSAPKLGEFVTSKPNILLIMAEDMSARVGYHGDKLANTPNIDQLASQGISYMRTFTAAPVCAPSRSAFIMSAHQQTIGTHHMRVTFKNYLAVTPTDAKAFPELLRAAGYYVTNKQKTDYQVGNPMTIWDESSRDAHWRNRPEDKPFFHMITLNITHESYIWPADAKATEGMSEAALNAIKNVSARNARAFAAQKLSTKPSDVIVPPYLPDTQYVREDLARHYNNIEYMDTQVGEILAELEADGLLDSTIVIWTTDHGDGLPRAKRSIYESGLHVPMTIRFPNGYGRGTTTDELISFVDLGPTLLALAGSKPAAHMQGNVFVGEGRDRPRSFIHAAADRHDEVEDRVRSVRDEHYKYIRNYFPKQALFQHMWYRDIQPTMQALWSGFENGTLNDVQSRHFRERDAEELYDLRTDPFELYNLAGDPEYAGALKELSTEMERFQAEYGDMGAIPENQMIVDMWPGGKQPVTSDPLIIISPNNTVANTVTITAKDNASIAYQIEGDKTWSLYTHPFALMSGATVNAQAVRYGYMESAVVSLATGD